MKAAITRILYSHLIVWFMCAEAKGSGQVFGHLDFKIVVEPPDAAPFTVVLLAPSRQEKAAWMSDISQVRCGLCQKCFCFLFFKFFNINFWGGFLELVYFY